MRPLDLLGMEFGRLTVTGRAPPKSDGAVWWQFDCSCGNSSEARGADIKRGFVQSCGCLRHELPKTRATHGASSSRLYRIWQSMKDRTGNSNASRYAYYGGRGITLCREWFDFETFQRWSLANGYQDDLSIDRINNYGNYEPANCRWATQQMQVRNRRSKEEMKGTST